MFIRLDTAYSGCIEESSVPLTLTLIRAQDEELGSFRKEPLARDGCGDLDRSSLILSLS
jgi:hypothetical protein